MVMNTKRDAHVTCIMSHVEKDLLAKAAAREGISVTAWIKRLVLGKLRELGDLT